MKPCAYVGCKAPSRARGFCENHYRRLLRRERGVGGVEPLDQYVYKVRVRTPHGSQPFYYSDVDKAMGKAAEARADNALLYFAEYRFNRVL